jgi:uncharacterized protein (DUF2336 family)
MCRLPCGGQTHLSAPLFVVLRSKSLPVTSEFRDLERPQALRRKDVVLMATVTSFEGLSHPTRSELRQFAELFMPIFSASSDEARRQAVAALAQSPNVPPAVAFFLGSQPIAVAAPFLMTSTCLSDEALITIARCQGADHARAIVRRPALSPTVIDALVGLRPDMARQSKIAVTEIETEPKPAELPLIETGADAGIDTERLAREEDLRRRIKLLAGHVERAEGDRLGLRSLSDVQQALLVRFARNREAIFLVTALSDILTTSRWLAERVLLDLSGRQLATVLKSLGMQSSDATYILTRLYGHLAEATDGVSEAERLWQSLSEDECHARVEAWRRADRYTYGADQAGSPMFAGENSAASAENSIEERPLRTSASVRRSASGSRVR